MVRLFDPNEFVMLSDGTKVHPHRSILRDGACCWGDAIPSGYQIREDRETQIVKTSHRIETFQECLNRLIVVTPGTWDGDSINDALEFTLNDHESACASDDSEPVLDNPTDIIDALNTVLGPFEKIFAIGRVFNYRRS